MEDTTNYRLLLEYDGTDFFGWQVQVGCRTVQGDLEAALQQLMGEQIRVAAAGRTDTGVHALGQVASFHSAKFREPEVVTNALNGTIQPDVRILETTIAPPDFHARFSAVWRHYRYRIVLKSSALERNRAWYPPFNVDWGSVERESDDFLGVQDFTAFSKASGESDNPKCDIQSIVWQREGHNIQVDIKANRFLHHMVRGMMGTLIDIGRGRFQPGTVKDLLNSRNREDCGVIAPAHGLYLVEVGYP